MPSISWVADEFKKHYHGTGWYAGLFLFGAILVAWGLYTNNIIATILFGLMVFLVYVLSHHHPTKVNVELHEKGINLNGSYYPYNAFKHFWISHHDDGSPYLVLETKTMFNRHVTVELDEQDADEVKYFLRQYMEEDKEHEENFVDFLLRKLKL